MIREEIERLSDIKLNPIGTEVETGYVDGLIPMSEHLDYEALCNQKRIAEIDVTDSNYTFVGSGCMPVNFYKGKKVKTLGVPTFFVFRMNKEQTPLKNQCVWIRGKDVIKCEHHVAYMGGKNQDNHYTNKADWHRGLESLIEELRRIAA